MLTIFLLSEKAEPTRQMSYIDHLDITSITDYDCGVQMKRPIVQWYVVLHIQVVKFNIFPC